MELDKNILEGCIEALSTHGQSLSKAVRNMSHDTFAKENIGNKKKMQKEEAELVRLQYDETDVKAEAKLHDALFDEEERHGVLAGVGCIYFANTLLKMSLDDNFGRLLEQGSPASKKVLEFCLQHIEIASNVMVAFTDRFNINAKNCANEEFGVDINLSEMFTDIDLLGLSNYMHAFSTRFTKSIEEQLKNRNK